MKIEVCYLQNHLSENRTWNLPEEKYKTYDLKFKTFGKLVLNNFLDLKNIIKEYETIFIIDNIPNFLSNIFITFFAKHKNLIFWVEEYRYDNQYIHKIKRYLKIIINYYLTKKSKKLIFFSKKSFDSYQGKKKKYLIPQTATYKFEIFKKKNTKKKQSLKLGYLGEFKDIKNIKLLIETVFELKNLNINLLLAGNKNKDNFIVNKYNNYNNIQFIGYINDKDSFFEEIDFLVLPSFYDAWGMVINEAMSKGIPCIVSDGVNSKEIIDKRFVFKNNSKKSLINVLLLAYNITQEEYETLSIKSIEKIEEYTIEESAKKIYEVLID
jgi:glycosyltransferase involved in cell wall biosynthesis